MTPTARSIRAACDSASIADLVRIGFATDKVFSDGVTTELATLTVSVAAMLVAGVRSELLRRNG